MKPQLTNRQLETVREASEILLGTRKTQLRRVKSKDEDVLEELVEEGWDIEGEAGDPDFTEAARLLGYRIRDLESAIGSISELFRYCDDCGQKKDSVGYDPVSDGMLLCDECALKREQ
jgi:hypothetical protein